jgi:hypothetical protein
MRLVWDGHAREDILELEPTNAYAQGPIDSLPLAEIGPRHSPLVPTIVLSNDSTEEPHISELAYLSISMFSSYPCSTRFIFAKSLHVTFTFLLILYQAPSWTIVAH